MVIINNGGGPGSPPDANYTVFSERLHSVGILVIGYTYVSFGSRNISDVKVEIDHYKIWYNVDGVFIDGMSYKGGDESYYSDLTQYARSRGLALVVGNPGTETLPSYVGTVDAIIIHEAPGLPSISYLGGWHTNYDKQNWGILPLAVNNLNKSYVVSASKYLGYIYITNGTNPEPWSTLPPYFGDLTAALDPASSSLTVKTQDTSGATLTGYWAQLYQNGNTVASGFTPITFTLGNGQTYTVEADGFGSCAFSHWLDTGSTSSQRSLSITSDTTLTAVLNCGTSQPSSLSVKSIDQKDNSIYGFYVTLYDENHGVLSSGFTTLTFNWLASGRAYVVEADDYGRCTFSRWEDGSTNFQRAFTATASAETFTAVYSCV